MVLCFCFQKRKRQKMVKKKTNQARSSLRGWCHLNPYSDSDPASDQKKMEAAIGCLGSGGLAVDAAMAIGCLGVDRRGERFFRT